MYFQGEGAFLYHMWTEVCIENRWIPVDATSPEAALEPPIRNLPTAISRRRGGGSAFLPAVQAPGGSKSKFSRALTQWRVGRDSFDTCRKFLSI